MSTYQQLHTILSGHHEGVHLEQIVQYLQPRKVQSKELARPFGKPSDASRTAINKGSATLADGVVVKIEEPDKEFIFAISKNLDIDEVQALLFLRSFLYNEGSTTMVYLLMLKMHLPWLKNLSKPSCHSTTPNDYWSFGHSYFFYVLSKIQKTLFMPSLQNS
ncbi:hypothetical protein C0993_003939 [Termitomyces sp. T159_Od127]|nr:hypothetical protein C0993_003939 [Termitomyces sp. T159_Od127]